MYKNSFVHYLTKYLIDVMFFGGILLCIALPSIMPHLARYLGYNKSVVLPFTIILLLSGLCLLFILWQLKSIFKSIIIGNPFVPKNVTYLRKCSVASAAISIIYLVKCIWWFAIPSAIVVIIFALLGLFCLTLKDLFKQSVNYKEENDWTV